MKILVTGSTAYDVLLSCDTPFRDGIDLTQEAMTAIFLTSQYARHHGGTAANIAWNLHLLGGDPLMVSTVGSDGGPYMALLRERGIDVTYIDQIDSEVTSTAIIGTDSATNQLGFFHAGADGKGDWPAYADAEASAGRPDLSEERDDISYAIISPRDEGMMLACVTFCVQYKIPYIFDPGQRITSMSADDMQRCVSGAYAMIANEYEWSVIGEDIGARAARRIVTRGERGASYVDEKGSELTVDACAAEKLINPTGAGDAFRAGLLFGLDAGWEMQDCLRLGNAMGSFAVELEGTLLDRLDVEEVWDRARRAYSGDLPSIKNG